MSASVLAPQNPLKLPDFVPLLSFGQYAPPKPKGPTILEQAGDGEQPDPEEICHPRHFAARWWHRVDQR
jgi:hypothetical protein